MVTTHDKTSRKQQAGRNHNGNHNHINHMLFHIPLPSHYRYRQTVYHITMTRRSEESAKVHPVVLDGVELILPTVPLVDDQREHYVEVNVS
jgi:hypothetical protein